MREHDRHAQARTRARRERGFAVPLPPARLDEPAGLCERIPRRLRVDLTQSVFLSDERVLLRGLIEAGR